jgi:menaquinone-dependent protoporphyrinogen oxidase
MHVLVAYESRHGATRGIAERIAETLRGAGLEAEARRVTEVKSLDGYDAFVIGSAAYMFHWEKAATSFVRHHRKEIAAKPTWLFSSGPTGTDPLDKDGRDQKVTLVPKEIPDLRTSLSARDHRVFFGAWDPSQKPVGLAERFMNLMPASAMGAMPVGDFRDWPEIEAWATEIAGELQQGLAG